MSVRQHAVEEQEHVVLVWVGDEVGDVVPNDGGVGHEHTTRVVSGRISVLYRDEQRPIEVGAGEEITLDVRRPYDVKALEVPLEVRCFYPRAVPGAVESISHLRHAEPREFPGKSNVAEVQSRE